MIHLLKWAGVIVLVFNLEVKAAEPPLLAPGNYEVTSQMIMPHLDEMRRISNHQQRCIGAEGALGLFPVMDQPALRGCRFGFGQAAAQTVTYLLVCQTARVATGTASITTTAKGIAGNADIKMGGKNMTFSQRIEAVRAGDCEQSRSK